MRKKLAAVCALLIGGSLAATTGTALLAGTAGANSPKFTLSCTVDGIPVTLKNTVVTGTLAKSVVHGKAFTLTKVALDFSFPDSGIFTAAEGDTISGTYASHILATKHATPAKQAVTFKIPSTKLPAQLPSGGVHISAATDPVHFKAPATFGVNLLTEIGAGGTLTINVPTLGLSNLKGTCTNPIESIALTKSIK